MLVTPENSSAVLVIIGSKCVPTRNRSHARRVNSGKITIFKGYPSKGPLWCPRWRGISSPSGTSYEMCSQEHRDYAIIRWKPGVSNSTWFDSVVGTGTWHQDRQADRRRDRQNYDSYNTRLTHVLSRVISCLSRCTLQTWCLAMITGSSFQYLHVLVIWQVSYTGPSEETDTCCGTYFVCG